MLANFSMHYFSGERGISADYFGRFCEGLKQKIAPGSSFVGIMSHGCSGDIWRRDYSRPDSWDKLSTIDQYTRGLLDIALKAYDGIKYGGDGYIPPPEQHLFGGYNTWAARSAGLEVSAEPKITDACIDLLEQVTGVARRDTTLSRGPAAEAIAALKPVAWYSLDEFAGPRALDSSGNRQDAIYEPAVTYYLEGPHAYRFCQHGQTNRAAMFVGGRLRTRLPAASSTYSVSLWLCNGMPSDGRDISGWVLSRGRDNGLGLYSEHLGIGGTSGHTGRLILQCGSDWTTIVAGKTEIPRWTWQHGVFARDGASVRVYLNGNLEIEIQAPDKFPDGFDQLFVGGRSDNYANWEGRLDEVVVFDRQLAGDEVIALCPQ